MRLDIRTKLREKLKEGIHDEANAVYLLVELRKLLEHESPKVRVQYFGLRFFCDWALHVQMDRTGAQRILKGMDSKIASHQAMQPMAGKEEKAIDEMFELVLFRKQFRKFLKRHSLPLEMVTDDELWFEFLELYSQVIADCPLVWNLRASVSPSAQGSHQSLQYIDSATIRMSKVPPRVARLYSGIYPLWIKWYGYKNKRQVFMFEGFGRPSKKSMSTKLTYHSLFD